MVTLRLREILKERQLTIAQFAEISGISQSNLSNYMIGKISPTLDTLSKIASALDIEITELFKKKEDIILIAKVNGHTYEISNEDLLDFIKQRQNK